VIAKVWTRADVEALGVRTDVPTAGAILAGLCRDESYRAVKRGKFPVPVLRVGRRLIVPVQPILQLLGLDTPAGGPSPEAPPAAAAEPSLKDTTGDKRTTAA
jgi:hypothetical protein